MFDFSYFGNYFHFLVTNHSKKNSKIKTFFIICRILSFNATNPGFVSDSPFQGFLFVYSSQFNSALLIIIWQKRGVWVRLFLY